MNIGDIVKFTGKDGTEVVGILYENGNKTYGDFRVQTIGVVKYKSLLEPMLQPATVDELTKYATKAMLAFSPEAVIEQEIVEAGGVLPEPITEKPTTMEDTGDGN